MSYREFFKNLCFSHVQTLFKTFSLSIQSIKASNQFFVIFLLSFCKVFSLPRPIRPYYPSFFIYFQVSCIFIMHIWEFSNLRNLGVFFFFFCWFKPFLSKLINGFLLWDAINMILVVQFDQFVELGKFGISRAWNYPNWGFCSIRFNLMKLACWIDSYDHYIVLSILINDQLVNFLKII